MLKFISIHGLDTSSISIHGLDTNMLKLLLCRDSISKFKFIPLGLPLLVEWACLISRIRNNCWSFT